MRFQEKIYNQSGRFSRNRDMLNVNTSSDICTFVEPRFYLSGATNTFNVTSASTGVYLVDDITNSLDLEFIFTGNTSSFNDTTIFKYEIYKYNNNSLVFGEPAIYQSDTFEYSSFSATSAITQSIPFNQLSLDGDYLVKGYFVHDVCTDILSRLGLSNDTSLYKYGNQYGIYNDGFDYYFVAVMEAAKPLIAGTALPNDRTVGGLGAHSVLLTSGQTQYLIETEMSGDILLYYNGLMLAKDLDYTMSGNLITFVVSAINGDVLTYVAVSDSTSNGLVVDNINIVSINSGITDNQGTALVYYNTDYGKYEIYTILTPVDFNDVVVTLNGVTLAPYIDYYQSKSNPNRMILEGTLLVGDVINIIYNAYPSYVGEIYTNTPSIYWSIPAPQLINGYFTVQVSSDKTFSTLTSTATTDYVVGQSAYSAQVVITGSVGTDLYYRVRNDKKYVTVSGNTIDSVAYSEVVPITIMSNAINSY